MGDTSTPPGSARLLSVDGALSLSGDGIVEVFLHEAWSPVCRISSGAASVLCRALGFPGTTTAVGTAQGTMAPVVGDMSCSGSEASVLECSFESGEDVYCAPSEA